jgi:hypothetical protein
MAPKSRIEVAIQNRWLEIRLISMWMTRRYCARGGTSSSSSRSTAMQKAIALK